MSTQNTRPPLFTQLLLLILIVAIGTGLIIGGAWFAATGNPWVALVVGLGAFAGTLVKLHVLVE